MKAKLENGDSMTIDVTRGAIDRSLPCCKEQCMVTEGTHDALIKRFGRGDYRIKTTTNGVKFSVDGHRHTGVFPPSTAKKIYNYDKLYKQTKNIERTRAATKPFQTKLVIIEVVKIEEYTENRRAYQREYRRDRVEKMKAKGLKPKKYTGQREISL